MSENLPNILKLLLQNVKPSSRRLKSGLGLAYTPAAANKKNPDKFRLVISRRGSEPSSQEIEAVLRDLRAVLLEMKRPYDAFEETAVADSAQEKKAWHSVVVEWHQLVQGVLL